MTALLDTTALLKAQKNSDIIRELAKRMKCSESEVESRLENMLQRIELLKIEFANLSKEFEESISRREKARSKS